MSIETHEGPAPADLERADDERYANEFNTIVATFRIALETMGPRKLTRRIADICDGRHPLSHEQPVIYFCDRYGFPAVLRALANAIADPINPLGQLEGD